MPELVVIVPPCESCGAAAEVELDDGSTWCEQCNTSAHNLGYDKANGRLITVIESRL